MTFTSIRLTTFKSSKKRYRFQSIIIKRYYFGVSRQYKYPWVFFYEVADHGSSHLLVFYWSKSFLLFAVPLANEYWVWVVDLAKVEGRCCWLPLISSILPSIYSLYKLMDLLLFAALFFNRSCVCQRLLAIFFSLSALEMSTIHFWVSE